MIGNVQKALYPAATLLVFACSEPILGNTLANCPPQLVEASKDPVLRFALGIAFLLNGQVATIGGKADYDLEGYGPVKVLEKLTLMNGQWTPTPLCIVPSSELGTPSPRPGSSVRTASEAFPTQGVSTSYIARADLNGDGIPDLVLAGDNPQITVYLSNSDGTLQQGVAYSVGSSEFRPTTIAIADFNGDGIPDLATTGDQIAILLGKGNGAFQQAKTYSVGGGSVAVGDFNGDGKLDLAVANSYGTSPSVLLMLGNGDGSFQSATMVTASAGLSIIAADFNGDGKLDLAIGQFASSPSLLVLLGNGNGSFQPPLSYNSGTGNGDYLAFADFNGDGKLDVAVSHTASGTLSVLLGNGNGSFQSPSTYIAGNNAEHVSMLDVDGDGTLDFTAGDFSSGGLLQLLLGNGDGTFQAPPFYSPPAARPGTNIPISSLAAADFNGDGKPDVASSDGSLWLGQGGGKFVLSSGGKTGASQSTSGVGFVVAGDFNGDGRPDLATYTGIALGNGDGTFKSVVPYPGGATGGYIIAGDFNRDGKLDLALTPDNPSEVLAGQSPAGISILLGNGDGTFKPPVTYLSGTQPYAIASGDFNGDGKLDLAVVNYGDGGLQGANLGGVSILLGNGDGTFTAGASFQAGKYPAHIAAGDVNGDGKLDLVVATTTNGFSGALAVFVGNGNGTFGTQALIPIPSGNINQWVTLVDVDGDSKLDILESEQNADVGLFAGNGDGTFRSEIPFPAGPNPLQLLIADFNADGKPDLAVADANYGSGGGGWTVILNNGEPVETPSLQIAKTHSGNFTQGQTNATYTLTISNDVNSGPTNGAVTVTDSLPAGLTLVSMMGTGWSCAVNSCTRGDALAAGASYPPITVTVNVASNAPAEVTNQASVTGGGGATPAGASDPTTINLQSTSGSVTIQTNPQGLQFTVDGGAPQTAPETLTLSTGTHTIAVAPTQQGATGIRYTFVNWNDGGAASHIITVSSTPATYTATFGTQYQLTISASPANGGSVTPMSGGYYDSGTSVPISASAASGFSFANWSGPVANSSNASTTVTMSGPQTVTANFSALSGITIQTSPTGLQFTVDNGALLTAPQVLTLSAGQHTIAVAQLQLGSPGIQWLFTNWSDGGAATHTITVTSSAAAYVATFTAQYQLTTSASPLNGGTVSPSSGAYYNQGTSVPITATPAAGYQFTSWTGPVGSSTSPATTVTMSQPQTVVANFAMGSFTLSQTSANFEATGGAGSVNVTATVSTASWSAISNYPFITITSGAGGTGNGAVNYTVAANTSANSRQGTMTIAGQTFTVMQAGAGQVSALRFIPLAPCRIMDTRSAVGVLGGPRMAAGATRTVPIPQSACGIPAGAAAYSLNVTVVPPGPLTYLSIWPAGQAQPVVSTLNSLDGRIVANAAIVPAGDGGGINVFVSNASDVIIDINGYFAPAATSGSLSFYSLPPCRVADTRNPAGALGGPLMTGGSTRSFPVRSSSCGVPASALAYSFNYTVVPRKPLGYLTTWPSGQTQPLVSTLNSPDGGVVANAAIVPAGSSGAVSVFVTDDTDVIIDINGYFAPPGSPGAQSLYAVTPCRVADTRGGFAAPFGPPGLAMNGSRNFPIPGSVCSGIPPTAQAYSLNVTVVPSGPLNYLTAWPAGQAQPLVSTLNSPAGKVVANAAIVPSGTSAAISIFVTNPTDLILDMNAYFAP